MYKVTHSLVIVHSSPFFKVKLPLGAVDFVLLSHASRVLLFLTVLDEPVGNIKMFVIVL